MLDGSDWAEGMERIPKYLVTDNGRWKGRLFKVAFQRPGVTQAKTVYIKEKMDTPAELTSALTRAIHRIFAELRHMLRLLRT